MAVINGRCETDWFKQMPEGDGGEAEAGGISRWFCVISCEEFLEGF